MKQRSLALFTLLLLAALSLVLPTVRVCAQTPLPVNSYVAVEVGLLDAFDVNDAGHVVGYDGWQAALVAQGAQTGLGTLGGSWSVAYALNNSDQAVGYSETAWGANHAFLWDKAGGMRDLGSLGGDYSAALDINDAGQVVGQSATAAGQYRAFLWQNGQMVDLGIPAGYVSSTAHAINASGQIVVEATDEYGGSGAFRWTPDVPNGTSGTFAALAPPGSSIAYGINGAGEAVGWAAGTPMLWDSTGAAHDLPLLPDASEGGASAISDTRLIVGWGASWEGSGMSSAFVWDGVNGTRDLDALAGHPGNGLHDAHGINASGQIVATSYEFSTYLLTPSPLPSRPLNLGAVAGNNRVDLAWNASSGATSYTVKRSSANSGTYVAVATLAGTNWTDTTVTNGTTYTYVVSARNGYGESADSAAVSATPTAPPAAPTNLTATAGKVKGNRQVTLKWNQSATPGVTQNRIYRSTANGGGYTLRGTMSAGTAFTDTSVTAGVTYYYVVTAVNGSTGQASGYSNQASAKVR